MKKLLLLLFFIFPAFHLFCQEPLPKGMTEAEKLIWDDYIKNYPTDKGTTPPAEKPRTPAEWEEAQGVVITWASYTSNLREITRYAKEVVTVYIVCDNPSSVQNYLSQGGVNSENVEFIVANYNSVWVRDYGPQSIYLNGTNELAIADWVYNRPRPLDNLIPSVVASHLDLPIYQMTQNPNRLVATGGNFMSDGFGKGFSSNLIIEENSSLTEAQIDTIVKKYMGIEPYVKMTTLPYDGIHHIDMHMKLLDEETLLVGQYPSGIADGPQIEANLNYILNNFQTPYGHPYRVVRIPMPPDENGYYPNQWSDYLTYTNSIILNNLVLVPIYGLPLDNEALSIYQDAMPGYNIVGINMRNVIPASGAIHCIAKEIAAHDPIFISHAPVRDEVEYSYTGYPFEASISSASGIETASLFWSLDPDDGYNELPMTFAGGSFKANITYLPPESQVYYYISATNSNAKTITKPLVAPDGAYVFEIGNNSLGFDFLASQTEVNISDEVVLTYMNQGVSAASFLWSFGDGATPATAETEGPHIVTYEAEGFKNISLTINDDIVLTKPNYIYIGEAAPNYFTLSVSVNGNGSTVPQAGDHQYTEGSLVTLSATPNNDWTFDRWEVNGFDNDDPNIQIEIEGNTKATAYFIADGTGINYVLEESIRVFPSPTKDMITIAFPKEVNLIEISIFGVAGNKINSFQELISKDRISLDVSNLQPGIYIVNCKTNAGVWSSKFVKL